MSEACSRGSRASRSVAVAAALMVVLAAFAPAAIAPAVAGTVAPPEPILSGPPPASWPAPDGIDGEAYLLMEASTGQLLVAVNGDQRRPVASTLKLLTAYTAIQRVDADEVVTVGEEVLGVAGANVGLAPGDAWTVEQLIDAIIGRSGNEAAEALAVYVAGDRESFLRAMEEEAAALGLEGIVITGPSGLDNDTLLSAHDLAVIGRAALTEPLLRAAMTRRVIALPGQPPEENRNELLVTYPGVTGMKTGFTTPAGYSLVGSAERGGRDLIAVVLGAGEDPQRFDSVAALLDHGFEATRPTELGTSIALAVAGGTVTFTTDQVELTVPMESRPELDVRFPSRVPDDDLRFALLVDGESLTGLDAVRAGGAPPVDTDGARIGRAVVDGTYAALRAATAAGTLG